MTPLGLTLCIKHRKQAIYVARTLHAGAVRFFFSQLCEHSQGLVNSEHRRVEADYRWTVFSSPFLSPVPRLVLFFFFCKNERIVAPLPDHQSLTSDPPPFVFCLPLSLFAQAAGRMK